MKVAYHDTLLPITAAAGKGKFKGVALDIDVESGQINGLKVLPESKLTFSDLITKGKGEADIDVFLSGSASDLFSYIREEPINASKYLSAQPEQIKGTISTHIAVDFPTIRALKNEDVKVKTSTVLKNGFVPAAFRGKDFSSPFLTIKAGRDSFQIEGDGQLGESTVSALKWTEQLKFRLGDPFKRKIKANFGATKEILELFNLDLSLFTSDVIPVSMTYTAIDEQKALMDIESDLQSSALAIPALDYLKNKDEEAVFSMHSEIENNSLHKILKASLNGPVLKANATDLFFRKGDILPYKGEISVLQIGPNENAKVSFFEDAGLLKILVKAKKASAVGFMNPSQGGVKNTLPALQIELTADQLLMKNDEIVTDPRLIFRRDAKGLIQNVAMSGKTDEDKFQLFFRPNEPDNPERLVFQAQNAGKALRAFGLFKTIQGGELNVIASGVENAPPQEVAGTLAITNFTVVDTPFIAQLLNSMTVEGLFTLFEEKGLDFNVFKARFRTQKGADDDWRVTFVDGKTKGGTLGLAFEGETNIDKKTLDIKGQIIPASGLNKAVSQIPVLGTILSGGDDSIFAATFSIKGSDDDPKVAINPVALLTPGFLRKFLFEND